MKYYIVYKKDYYSGPCKYGFVAAEQPCNELELASAIEYDAMSDAIEAVHKLDNELYITSHNEIGRPAYKIIGETAAYRLSLVWEHNDMGAPMYYWDDCADPANPTDDEIVKVCAAVENEAWNNLEEICV